MGDAMIPLPRWYTAPLFPVIAVLFARSQDVRKLDPSLDQILPSNATVERVATGFNKWVEGPVWTHDGSLLFAEIPANNINIWDGRSPTISASDPGQKKQAVRIPCFSASDQSGTPPYQLPSRFVAESLKAYRCFRVGS